VVGAVLAAYGIRLLTVPQNGTPERESAPAS